METNFIQTAITYFVIGFTSGVTISIILLVQQAFKRSINAGS